MHNALPSGAFWNEESMSLHPVIRPFSPEHVCSGCGSEGAAPVHHSRPVLLVFGGPQWHCSGLDDRIEAHLCLRCEVCGFTWIEEIPPGMDEFSAG